jgi:hypothetical protein
VVVANRVGDAALSKVCVRSVGRSLAARDVALAFFQLMLARHICAGHR